MFTKHYLHLLFVILLILFVRSKYQASVDSLEYFDNMAIKYKNISPDSSEFYLRKYITHSNSKDYDNLAYAYTFQGVLKKQLGQLDSALFYYQVAIKYQKIIDHPEGIAGNYNNIGNVYKQKGDYLKAITHYQMSKAIFLDSGMEDELFMVIENISELYLAMEKIQDAKSELELSKKYFVAKNVPAGIGLIQACLSDVSLAEGDTLTALLQIDSALKVFKSIKYQTKYVIHGIKHCEILFLIDSLDKNVTILEDYLHLAKNLNLALEEGQLLVISGKINLIHNRVYEAISILEKSISIIQSVGSDRYLIEAYRLISKAFEQKGDFKTALYYHQQFTDLYNSTQGIEIQKNFQSLQVKYRVLENAKALDESKLTLLEKENKLQQANLKVAKKEQQSRIIWIIVISISILLIFIFLRFREKQKLSKQLTQTLDERNLLLKEIHHRVKNNLQIINSLLNLQKNRGTNSSPSEIITETQDRIYSMAIIHEKLYQSENFSNISIKDYVETLIEHFNESQNYSQKNIRVSYQIDDFTLPLDSLIPIGLILNETFTNTSKYAFDENGGEIKVLIRSNELSFDMTYEDNGKGLPNDFSIDKANSLGMKLIKGFTKQLKGTLAIENQNGLKLFFTFRRENPH